MDKCLVCSGDHHYQECPVLKKSHEEYEKFMKQYNKDHAVCPECGRREYSVTLVGFVYLNREDYKDKNDVTCKCGWRGIVHDLKPKDATN